MYDHTRVPPAPMCIHPVQCQLHILQLALKLMPQHMRSMVPSAVCVLHQETNAMLSFAVTNRTEQSLSPTAAAGQCDTDYITAGVTDARFYFSEGHSPDGSPSYGCLNPTSGIPTNCLTTRAAFSNWYAFDGETDGTDANDGAATEPDTRYWHIYHAFFQATLDQAYPDGGLLAASLAISPCFTLWHLV